MTFLSKESTNVTEPAARCGSEGSEPSEVKLQQPVSIAMSLNRTDMTKKRSLNEMVLTSLAALQEATSALEPATRARDVTDYICEHYEVNYPIQTIIVVLNRLVKKGIVTRRLNSGLNARHRYCFYLNQSPVELREERIMQRLKGLADEFYGGDVALSIVELQKLVESEAKTLDADSVAESIAEYA